MTEAEIRRQISKEQASLKKLQENKNIANRDFEKCEALKSKFCSLKSNFVSKQSLRNKSLNNILNKSNPIKAVKKYYSNMSLLLNNKEYYSAVNGIDSAIGKAGRKMEEITQNISSLDKQIYQKQRKISGLKAQLKTAILEAQNVSK